MEIIGDGIIREKFWIKKTKHPEDMLPHVVGKNVLMSECLTQSETGARQGVEDGNGQPELHVRRAGCFHLQAEKPAITR